LLSPAFSPRGRGARGTVATSRLARDPCARRRSPCGRVPWA
jgi:hypothetical protein